jgi:hypothetical protein
MAAPREAIRPGGERFRGHCPPRDLDDERHVKTADEPPVRKGSTPVRKGSGTNVARIFATDYV